MKIQLKISISYNTLCQLHKCSVGLKINQKMREMQGAIRKKKYVSFKKDWFFEGQMNDKKE